MLFLAPPADMLPPAGHRAGPGRAHTGPIARSGRPGGRPRVLPRAAAAAAEAEAAPQSRANSSSSSRLPGAAGPAAGAGDREAGLARARKVSAGEIPAWSRPGQAGRSARDPRQVPRTATALPSRLRARAPGARGVPPRRRV